MLINLSQYLSELVVYRLRLFNTNSRVTTKKVQRMCTETKIEKGIKQLHPKDQLYTNESCNKGKESLIRLLQ